MYFKYMKWYSYKTQNLPFVSGIAPFCVHTKALTSTASLWASFTDLPLSIAAQKEPVKESPAPTVSATSTLGVFSYDICPGVNT